MRFFDTVRDEMGAVYSLGVDAGNRLAEGKKRLLGFEKGYQAGGLSRNTIEQHRDEYSALKVTLADEVKERAEKGRKAIHDAELASFSINLAGCDAGAMSALGLLVPTADEVVTLAARALADDDFTLCRAIEGRAAACGLTVSDMLMQARDKAVNVFDSAATYADSFARDESGIHMRSTADIFAKLTAEIGKAEAEALTFTVNGGATVNAADVMSGGHDGEKDEDAPEDGEAA